MGMKQIPLMMAAVVVLVGQSVLAADKKSSVKGEPVLPLPAEPEHGRPYLMLVGFGFQNTFHSACS